MVPETFAREGEAEHGLVVPLETCRAFLAERSDANPAHAGDLYLACACLARVPGAPERLWAVYAPSVERALERVALGALLDDARALASRACWETPRPTSSIGEYSGRGPLGGWLQVLAVRAARERAVLRLNFLEGLSVDEIGRLYGVHRATVARWIAGARQTVRDGTRAALAGRHPRHEVEGLMQFADEGLDVSLSALLSVSRE